MERGGPCRMCRRHPSVWRQGKVLHFGTDDACAAKRIKKLQRILVLQGRFICLHEAKPTGGGVMPRTLYVYRKNESGRRRETNARSLRRCHPSMEQQTESSPDAIRSYCTRIAISVLVENCIVSRRCFHVKKSSSYQQSNKATNARTHAAREPAARFR